MSDRLEQVKIVKIKHHTLQGFITRLILSIDYDTIGLVKDNLFKPVYLFPIVDCELEATSLEELNNFDFVESYRQFYYSDHKIITAVDKLFDRKIIVKRVDLNRLLENLFNEQDNIYADPVLLQILNATNEKSQSESKSNMLMVDFIKSFEKTYRPERIETLIFETPYKYKDDAIFMHDLAGHFGLKMEDPNFLSRVLSFFSRDRFIKKLTSSPDRLELDGVEPRLISINGRLDSLVAEIEIIENRLSKVKQQISMEELVTIDLNSLINGINNINLILNRQPIEQIPDKTISCLISSQTGLVDPEQILIDKDLNNIDNLDENKLTELLQKLDSYESSLSNQWKELIVKKLAEKQI